MRRELSRSDLGRESLRVHDAAVISDSLTVAGPRKDLPPKTFRVVSLGSALSLLPVPLCPLAGGNRRTTLAPQFTRLPWVDPDAPITARACGS